MGMRYKQYINDALIKSHHFKPQYLVNCTQSEWHPKCMGHSEVAWNYIYVSMFRTVSDDISTCLSVYSLYQMWGTLISLQYYIACIKFLPRTLLAFKMTVNYRVISKFLHKFPCISFKNHCKSRDTLDLTCNKSKPRHVFVVYYLLQVILHFWKLRIPRDYTIFGTSNKWPTENYKRWWKGHTYIQCLKVTFKTFSTILLLLQ